MPRNFDHSAGHRQTRFCDFFIGLKAKIVFFIGCGMTVLRMCAIMTSFHLSQGDMNLSDFQILDIVDARYLSSNISPQEV